MMNKRIPKECIIIGGGRSIQKGLSLNVGTSLLNKFVITVNYAYKHFPHTFVIFGDDSFYVPLQAKKNPAKHPDIYEELKKEPLIIYARDNNNNLGEWQLSNTIFIRTDNRYNTNPLKEGFYTHFLTGINALSLAQFLLDYNGRIFLCGFDWGSPNKKEKDIHYYSKEEINHRGMNLTSPYINHNPKKYFGRFKESNIKIYNVSLQSNIDCFEKISYEQFFGLMSNKIENQDELRQKIRNKLCIR